jgi:hypothetical protein
MKGTNLDELPLDEAISSSCAATGAGASLSPPAEQLLLRRHEVPEVEQTEDLPVVASAAVAVDEPSFAFVATNRDGRQIEVGHGVGRGRGRGWTWVVGGLGPIRQTTYETK